ncbi:methylamine utilization protein MauE [Actinomadura sp. KC345]|uniref:MauE/DoxX family redox-associated membrane protein n=1 Tax=Actinomadura sp. KC345 TaxID=2530371 RepID=UPI001045CD25|nr:MauE/DoxX family redox-associated membrane protein [Actinomadura sp. KC345]TDC57175.1 methylamine utilization protein MauE [Actinomadura sp. KC345]
MGYVVLGCRCVVGFVFLASVVGKLRGRDPYSGFVVATGRLGPRWLVSRVPAGVLAPGVIAAEAAVLVLLLRPRSVWVGFLLAGLLACAFAVAVLAALRRRDRAPCHCFGGSARPVGVAHLVRNGVLAAAAGLGLAGGADAAGRLKPAGVAATVVAAVVVVAVVMTADEIAGLFKPVASTDVHPATKGSMR